MCFPKVKDDDNLFGSDDDTKQLPIVINSNAISDVTTGKFKEAEDDGM